MPDITVYVERLEAKLRSATLQRVRLLDAFVLRTALPPLDVAAGRAVVAVVPGGRLLADRALWRLLKASWPSSIDELG